MPQHSIYREEVRSDLNDIPAEAWNALVPADNPFFEYGFLYALEASGCVGPETSWHPRYVLLRDPAAEDRLIGAVALYFKFDSYGEYIFDHAWADAYMRSGLPYYPKGLVAAPFTPTNGQRLLVHPDYEFKAVASRLIEVLLETTEEAGVSSLHLLFVTEEESDLLRERGFLTRISTQFHWFNRGYECFDDFLGDLRSQKRKQLRKERRSVADQGIDIQMITGDAITPDMMETMYRFYIDTGNRKWGQPYLNRRWFQLIREHFRHRIVLALAYLDGAIVAGTLNFHGGDKLYGRYWGASDEYPCLHFELCYYQLIDYAIQHGVKVFEAGAQGEHKFLRGFETRPCYSSHRMSHPEGQRAIRQFLETERDYIHQTIHGYNAQSPLKHLREREGGRETEPTKSRE
ncbi:MAG: GNAT family N-acetyltransferase [bacterium]|nr:GNAT family N-acetyltransferase [bacterium]